MSATVLPTGTKLGLITPSQLCRQFKFRACKNRKYPTTAILKNVNLHIWHICRLANQHEIFTMTPTGPILTYFC